MTATNIRWEVEIEKDVVDGRINFVITFFTMLYGVEKLKERMYFIGIKN